MQRLLDEVLKDPKVDGQRIGMWGVPSGWSKYGGGKDQELKIVDGPDGRKTPLIADVS